jgi:hypothetical protein
MYRRAEWSAQEAGLNQALTAAVPLYCTRCAALFSTRYQALEAQALVRPHADLNTVRAIVTKTLP